MNSAAVPSIFDVQSLAALKKDVRKDDPQALKQAAQQFESVFLQMVLKSMRAATPQDSMFDSEQTKFYQELLDSQLAQVMSHRGGLGLAALIERQLARPDAAVPPGDGQGIPLTPPARAFPLESSPRSYRLEGQAPAPIPLDASPVRPAQPVGRVAPAATVGPLATSAPGQGASGPQDFVATLWPHAVAASDATGIPPQFMLAHAALESGWGKAEPHYPDGTPSHNLFGIKAGSQWQGPVVEAATTEYANGVAQKRVERFRAYGSYAEAFQDYARLLAQSPRYAAVVGSRDAASFAQGLQRAGYATDPTYAAKLQNIINGPSLNLALAG